MTCIDSEIYRHVILTFQGYFVEAEVMCERSLTILENTLGAYHPDVATTPHILMGLVEFQVKAVGMLRFVY